jgi:hypothetical protein
VLTPFGHYAGIERTEGRAAANAARKTAGLPVDEEGANEMIAMNPNLPPAPRAETVAEVLRLLADPAALKARIEQFAEMAATARDAAVTVAKLQQDAAAARDELAGLRDEMKAERAAHDARATELADRENRVAELHSDAREKLEQIAAHKADLARVAAAFDLVQ